MDKVLERFGIYDFLGIWAPGAICVTYYLFTLTAFFHRIFEWCGITQRLLEKGTLVILLYTAVAYVVGVLLHELGKIVIDFFSCFDTNRVIENVNDDKFGSSNRWHVRICHVRICHVRIRDEIKRTIDQIKEHDSNFELKDGEDSKPGFEYALDSLKFTRESITRHVDMDRSVYALSRSLCLCFIGHFVLIFVECLLCHTKLRLLLLGVDMALIALFLIRAYRYLYRWVINVYIQYYFEFEKPKSGSAAK